MRPEPPEFVHKYITPYNTLVGGTPPGRLESINCLKLKYYLVGTTTLVNLHEI